MPNAPVAAAVSGLPEFDIAESIFPKHRLATMSMCDLAQLSQLLSSIQGAITASSMINGPGGLTPACAMLQDLSGVIIGAISDITAVARAHQPTNQHEANWRGWVLVSNAALFCDDLSEIAVMAAGAAAAACSLKPPRH